VRGITRPAQTKVRKDGEKAAGACLGLDGNGPHVILMP
jgi:hypothetical protein